MKNALLAERLATPIAAWRALWREQHEASCMQAFAFATLAGGLAGGAFDRSVDTPINQMRLLHALLRRRANQGQQARQDT